MHFICNCITLYDVQIKVEASALGHLITETEIRTVVSYPELRIGLTARREGADPVLFVGRADVDEPHIEVIADLIDPTEMVVFHAMMLRPSLVRNLTLELFFIPEYAAQRA